MSDALAVDVVIFGGGAAGLWLLDDLTRAGRNALLLEANDLGSGQTITSQGIIHGGLKYTLSGLLTPSARAIAEMPLIWRRCLAGEALPDLSGTRMRAQYCHVWRTESLRSKLALVGARAGLRVAPVKLSADERPAALADCPGIVSRLDEQVIEPGSFLGVLYEKHKPRVLKIDATSGLEITARKRGNVEVVRLINPETGEPIDLRPAQVVFTAGEGNARLRELARLSPRRMQRRPLHMVMLRARPAAVGPRLSASSDGQRLSAASQRPKANRQPPGLPVLNGHCVDGSATRVTITTTRDFSDRIIWQVGGQIAERGVKMEPAALVDHARRELREVLPGFDFAGVEWATYRVNRAEAATWGLNRPNDAYAAREGNTITAWPTKLALVPELSRRVMRLIDTSAQPAIQSQKSKIESLPRWPRPVVALPPWETCDTWIADD